MDYRKLFWAILGALALGVQGALTDDTFSVEEVVTVTAAGLAAVSTWLVPNTPRLAAAKTWVTAIVLGAGVLVPLLVGGVTAQEWVSVGLSVMTAAGVYLVPGPKSQYELAG
jgi:hypothetical protein